MPALTPAETLIAFSELDYAGYRKAVRWLQDEHPLFEERIDIPVSDLEDFAVGAILLTPDLCEIDPVSGFVVTDILHRALQAEDDGTAMFLLAAGQEILRVMEEPLRVQNYLRNIMEVTFDGTAGLTPAEQYENLRAAYADIARICDPAKLPQLEKPRSFQLRSLIELRMLVLALYFEQDNQRVCRCNYCWGYFIPKTKKTPRYCDRVTDGQSCKQRGANLARLDMKRQLLERSVIHADETVVQGLKEDNKPAASESRMWLYASGEYSSQHIRIFEYQPDRSGKRPESFLKGFSGCLITDGYAGYTQVQKVTRCGCWAHAR